MITNMWNQVKLICGNNHEKMYDMEINQSGKALNYICSKKIECNCINCISITDFEKVIKHISNEIETAEMNNQIADLTNVKFKINNINYKILKHKTNKILVEVLNKKSFK